MEPRKRYYSWGDLDRDCQVLATGIRELQRQEGFQPDTVLAIARGGLAPAAVLANLLGIRTVASVCLIGYTKPGQQEPQLRMSLAFPFGFQDIGDHREVLVVDDICDSGRSLLFVGGCLLQLNMQFRSAVLHYKPGAVTVPSVFARQTTDWIVYPWEKE